MLHFVSAEVCSRDYKFNFVAGTRKPWVAHVEPLVGMEAAFAELLNTFTLTNKRTQEVVTVLAPKRLFWVMLKAVSDHFRRNKRHSHHVPFRLEFLGMQSHAH